ncbi:MAG: hypothetical protein P1U34_12515 [Coxiellaceae bacterium]|nr:hypothetical protein [Coxiellaceae bacterium]
MRAHWLNEAVVIGDGPGGLAYAIVLWQARCHDPDFKMTVVGDRFGQYSREQGLRFDQDQFLIFLREFLDVEVGEAEVATISLNLQLEWLLGKSPDGREYIKLHRSSSIIRSLNDSTAFALFGNRPYCSIEIKHLEQLLFKRLQQLTAGDPRCRFVFKKRDKVTAPLGAVRDISAVGEVTLEVDAVEAEAETKLETTHPDAVFALDGVYSKARGVLAHIDGKLPPDRKIQSDEVAPEPLLHQAHSVGTYDTTLDVDAYLFNIYSRDGGGGFSRRLRNVRPVLSDFYALGWREPFFPIARIIPLKRGLYIGVQTPREILEEGDEAVRREKLMQWHKLVLRRVLPVELVDELAVKGVEAREKDDPSKAAEDRARRERREKLRIAGFEVVFAPGIKEPVIVLSEKTLLIPGADAFNGLTVNYQTAQGAFKALQGALALKKALSEATSKLEFQEIYAAEMQRLKQEKALSNVEYSEQEMAAKQLSEDGIRQQLVAAIAFNRTSEQIRRDFPYLNAEIINVGRVSVLGARPLESLLYKAVEKGSVSLVKFFLTRGGDLATRSSEGVDLFYTAVLSGQWSVQQLSAVFGDPTEDMLNQVRGDFTLLGDLVRCDNAEMVAYLLNQGANPGYRVPSSTHSRFPYQLVRTNTQLPLELLRRLASTDPSHAYVDYVSDRVSPDILIALADDFNAAEPDVQQQVFNYLRLNYPEKYLKRLIGRSHKDTLGVHWVDEQLRRVVASGSSQVYWQLCKIVRAILQSSLSVAWKVSVIQRNRSSFEGYIEQGRGAHGPSFEAVAIFACLTDLPKPRGCFPVSCGGAAKLEAKYQQLRSLRRACEEIGEGVGFTQYLQRIVDMSPKSSLAVTLKKWRKVPSVASVNARLAR